MRIGMKKEARRVCTRPWWRTIAVGLVAIWSCRVPGPPNLAGTWNAEFRLGARVATGTISLSLAPIPPTTCGLSPARCAAAVRGNHQIDFQPLLGHPLTAEVLAGSEENGDITLLLGRCCDQGELSGIGRLDKDTLRGRWSETFIVDGRKGTFTLTRLR